LSKSIGLVITAWTLKYGAMNSNGINWVSPQVDYSQNTQSLKALKVVHAMDTFLSTNGHFLKVKIFQPFKTVKK
jgi:hypothetical protein